MAVHRRRYRELMRDKIAQTLHDPAQVEEELRSLQAALAAEPFRDSATADFYRVPMPTLCTVWKSLPSVLMLGAMMISVS